MLKGYFILLYIDGLNNNNLIIHLWAIYFYNKLFNLTILFLLKEIEIFFLYDE